MFFVLVSVKIKFCVIKIFQSICCCYSNQPLELILMLFLIWLYHQDYKGGLFLGTFVRNKIAFNKEISARINSVSQNITFLISGVSYTYELFSIYAPFKKMTRTDVQ